MLNVEKKTTIRNIEPRITRQRVIIEAHYSVKINPQVLRDFLTRLAMHLGMKMYIPSPLVFSATGHGDPIHHGYEALVVWVESGASVYVWEKLNFLTVDIYTCKPFDTLKSIDFTRDFFKTTEIEYQEV